MIDPATIKAPPLSLLFVKTSTSFSKAIMWGFNDPVSHLGVDLAALETVVHSDLLGLHAMQRLKFLESHVVVATFNVWLDEPVRLKAQQGLLARANAAKDPDYDYGAFAYLTYRAALRKVFGAGLPAKNPWQSGHEYLCTEAAYFLNAVVIEGTGRSLFTTDLDLAAMTPWQLYGKLKVNAAGANELDLRGCTITRAPHGNG
jgi:hypothetical protein